MTYRICYIEPDTFWQSLIRTTLYLELGDLYMGIFDSVEDEELKTSSLKFDLVIFGDQRVGDIEKCLALAKKIDCPAIFLWEASRIPNAWFCPKWKFGNGEDFLDAVQTALAA